MPFLSRDPTKVKESLREEREAVELKIIKNYIMIILMTIFNGPDQKGQIEQNIP